jgi:hypothetical protein
VRARHWLRLARAAGHPDAAPLLLRLARARSAPWAPLRWASALRERSRGLLAGRRSGPARPVVGRPGGLARFLAACRIATDSQSR